MKNKGIGALAMAAAIGLGAGVMSSASAAYADTGEGKTVDNGEVTVFVYMIGSDLETDGGNASLDLKEMLAADLGEQVNLVIQTGGAMDWEMEEVREGTCQRFEVVDHELKEVEDIGLQSMAKIQTLASFLTWGAEAYPADRYELIFWDHGGGVTGGFGYDEYFEDDWLTLSDIGDALKLSGVEFDMVGFDACLMSTIEVAYMLKPYAEYLVASEEYIPAEGWYYTDWLTDLGQNPQMEGDQIGVAIVDDYAAYYEADGTWEYTLSVVDLNIIGRLYKALSDYMEETSDLLTQKQFTEISSARAQAKAFGDGDYELIDLLDYADRIESLDDSKLQKQVDACVIYNRSNISNACGLAMYYPYKYLDSYEYVWKDLSYFDYTDGYGEYFNQFASVLAGGHTGTTGGYFQPQEESWDTSLWSWIDEMLISDYDEVYLATNFEAREMVDKGEYFALPMTEEDWELITYIEQWVMLDDGEGYVDLGCDNYYEVDEDGDLMLDFDYYWVALDGMIVPFYAEVEDYSDEETWYTYGYVPAELNESEDIEIIVRWDAQHEDGYVSGWRYAYEGLGQAAAKGLFQFKTGDQLDIICDFYTYDGAYDGEYYWGDTLYVGPEGLAVSYEDLGEETTLINYMLEDIYCNQYVTDPIELSFGEYWD